MFALWITLFVSLVSCSTPSKPTKPLVLSSIPPYVYFVEKIAGDTVEVSTVVPPGTNPHLFEPTVQEASQVARAALWLRCGEPFEERILKAAHRHLPSLCIVDMNKNISLRHAEGCSHTCSSHTEDQDRHTWLSLRLAQQQAKTLAEALIALYPQHRSLYLQKLGDFLKELQEADTDISSLLAPLKGKALLVSHPAFGYFCQDYHLCQLSVECEGKDPLPQDVTRLLAQAQKTPIQCILTQPQYNNKGATLIAEKLHLPIYLVDPYSSDYLSNIRRIARIIHDDSPSEGQKPLL